MARARNFKPGFFRDAALVELPVETRLLFPGLWTLADRAGRLEDKPKQIKMEIYPADNFDVDVMLIQLQTAGLIIRYEVDGKRFIQIKNFLKHQNPHRDEKESEIPEPLEHCASTVQAQCEHGVNRASTYNLSPDCLNLVAESNQPKVKTRAAAKVLEPYPDEFEESWNSYPRTKDASKRDAFKAWGARVKAGVDPASILAGVKRYAAYCAAMQKEQQYIKQPATFFGPGEHYAVAWDVPVIGARRPAPENFASINYGESGKL